MINLHVILLLITSVFAQENWTFKAIDEKEKVFESWVKKVGGKELLQIGRMKQQPQEVDALLIFYPYLLPEGFFGKKSAMDCFIDLNKLKKTRKKEDLKKWKNCWINFYGGKLPQEYERAIGSFSLN